MKSTSIFPIALFALALFAAVPARAEMGHIHNHDIGFAFDLPRGWEGYRASADGESYIIVTRDQTTDIWMFAGPELPVESTRVEPFFFRDRVPGKKFTTGSGIAYSRLLRGYTFTLNVNAPPSWIKAHRVALDDMAASLVAAR